MYRSTLINFAAAFAVVLSIFAFGANAQTTAADSDEINKVEGFAGYTYNSFDLGFDESDFDEDFGDISSRQGAHGFNGAVNYNFHKMAGVKFDFSTASTSESIAFTDPVVGPLDLKVSYRVSNFLGGVQFKNNRKDGPRVKPFAHLLAGVAQQKLTLSGTAVQDFIGENSISESQTNFAMAVGGGVDVKVHKNVDLRLFQIDYNPIFMGDIDLGGGDVIDGRMLNNFRISVGLVFH